MSKLLAGTFVGLAFALAATSATAAEPNATLSNVSGNVSVNQGKEFAPAQADMRLKPGDRVMISDKGSATITFDDACRLDLGESKIITVPANPEVSLYQERHGAIIQRRQVKHWLDATVPEADLLVTPPARLFRVEEIDPAPRQETFAL